MPIKHEFKAGDHVEWNSETGRVCGTIKKKVTSAIKSYKTDHMAMHKGSVLKQLKSKS